LAKLVWPKGTVHSLRFETVYAILSRIHRGKSRMTTIERTKPAITHNSAIYHIDRLLRADLISADRKNNLTLTAKGERCLRSFQDIEDYLRDTALEQPYKPIRILTRAHFEYMYDDGTGPRWRKRSKRRR
jgi:predicted transcriptional regulator